jgi:uncharacterized protein YegJ (DUF2314 family)
MIMRADVPVRILFLISTLFFLSCDKLSFLHRVGQKPESAAVYADHTDTEILTIAEDSRNTLSVFFRRLARPDSNERNFCVKYPFLADEGSGIHMEHIWLTGIHFKKGSYYGTLSASPLYLHNRQRGDKVSFNPDDITDWMYTQGDKIIGGYSIKYLLENIPEDRRSEEQQKILDMF